jgi:arylsulfatase A-like enzyme/predicted Zn-dependent protease
VALALYVRYGGSRGGGGATMPTGLAPPDVLFISIDTLRADHLGAYGARVPTPHIDRLASEGVLFERAVSHVPITLPSHTTMLTGTYPIYNGVRDNGSFRLDTDKETLAELFRVAGYHTGAFVGSFALDSRFGLDQGFEVYDDYYGDSSAINDFSISERPADAVVKPALEWIAGLSDERWFAFVHLYDPHAPYSPPSPFRETHGDDLYSGEVAYVDDVLGRFLGELEERGSMKNTLVVLTSDHGEGLGEHGEKTHGMFAYDATLHVPLIFRWKGVLPQGRRVPSRVRLIDIASTLVEMTGVSGSASNQGESLVPLIFGDAPAADRDSYFEALAFNLNRNWAPLTGLYKEHFKYIDLPIRELYDLESDPGETNNLYPKSPGQGRQMAAALEELLETYSTESSRAIRTAEVDAETVRRLRALGYVTAPAPTKAGKTYTVEDDPKRLVGLSDRFDAAVAANMAGRPEEAIRLFRSVIEERPSFSIAYANLAFVLRESGHLKEAIDILEEAIARGAQTANMRGRLGAYLQEAGRLEESVSLLEALVAEDPSYTEAYNYLGVSYSRLGRNQDAIEALEKVIARDPSYASAYANMGSVYLSTERYSQAEEEFKRAVEIDPRLAFAWNGLGVVYASTDRMPEAISAWTKSVELDGRQYDTLYNLGTLLVQLNRFDEGIIYLERFVRNAPSDRYGADIPKVKRLIAELKARG